MNEMRPGEETGPAGRGIEPVEEMRPAEKLGLRG